MRVTQHVLFRIVISLLGVLLVAGHTAHATPLIRRGIA